MVDYVRSGSGAVNNTAIVGHYYKSLSVSTSKSLVSAAGAGKFRDLTSITLSVPFAASSTSATIVLYSTLTSGAEIGKLFVNCGETFQLKFDPPLLAATANVIMGIKSTRPGTTVMVDYLDRAS
jgi:hypothetical protein